MPPTVRLTQIQAGASSGCIRGRNRSPSASSDGLRPAFRELVQGPSRAGRPVYLDEPCGAEKTNGRISPTHPNTVGCDVGDLIVSVRHPSRGSPSRSSRFGVSSRERRMAERVGFEPLLVIENKELIGFRLSHDPQRRSKAGGDARIAYVAPYTTRIWHNGLGGRRPCPEPPKSS